MRRGAASLLLGGIGMGCGPAVDLEGTADSSSTSTSTPSITTASTSSSTLSPDGATGTDVTTEVSTASLSTTTGLVETTSGPATRGSSSTGWDCTVLPTCGGKIYSCADGQDNDDDGFIDLDDPECVSVCDDHESSFGFFVPGDALVCTIDCFFDGNSGMGDDLCAWNIRCDALGPGAAVGCPSYEGPPPQIDRLCSSQPMTPLECVGFCEPLVPNGCDCFGCCTFQTADGPKNFFLEHYDCTASDGFAGCPECTQHMELCGNPCEPEACEVCLGAQAPPAGCDEVGCVGGIPCAEQCDCPMDHQCITGCCLPAPPG